MTGTVPFSTRPTPPRGSSADTKNADQPVALYRRRCACSRQGRSGNVSRSRRPPDRDRRVFTACQVLDRRCCSVQISLLWRGSSVSPPRRVATGLGQVPGRRTAPATGPSGRRRRGWLRGPAAPEAARGGKRIGRHAVGGKQVGEHNPLPCHHRADLSGDLARAVRREAAPGCSSARAPCDTTCARPSPSSVSPRAPSWPLVLHGRPIRTADPLTGPRHHPAAAASVRCSCWTSAPESLSAAISAGVSSEFGENTGVVLTLPGGLLALVSHNLVREVPWPARDLYLASRPVGHRAYRLPLACPIAVCELPEGADLAGRDLRLVQLRVERSPCRRMCPVHSWTMRCSGPPGCARAVQESGNAGPGRDPGGAWRPGRKGRTCCPPGSWGWRRLALGAFEERGVGRAEDRPLVPSSLSDRSAWTAR